jgi:hypothetical protein
MWQIAYHRDLRELDWMPEVFDTGLRVLSRRWEQVTIEFAQLSIRENAETVGLAKLGGVSPAGRDGYYRMIFGMGSLKPVHPP